MCVQYVQIQYTVHSIPSPLPPLSLPLHEAMARQAGKLKVCEGRVRVRGEGVGVAVTVVEGWDGESVRCYLV